MCPLGTGIDDVSGCQDASFSILGDRLQYEEVVLGLWDHVPCGCSVQVGSGRIHFNKNKNYCSGNNDYWTVRKTPNKEEYMDYMKQHLEWVLIGHGNDSEGNCINKNSMIYMKSGMISNMYLKGDGNGNVSLEKRENIHLHNSQWIISDTMRRGTRSDVIICGAISAKGNGFLCQLHNI
jgi:hypothetical protein